MIEIFPKPKKLLNDLQNLENYKKKWPQNLNFTKILPKPKKKMTKNTPETQKMTKIPLKPKNYQNTPKPEKDQNTPKT